jgi:hypothetical protein
VTSQATQDDVLGEFLSEFANHLLKCGITMAEFRKAAQGAFVQAALSASKLQNSRVNQSAVAAMTGLSRTQVRALLREPPEATAPIGARISAVISGWRTDPEFTDADGSPLALATSPGKHSFHALIKKYGRDVSHRAMLSEMRRMGYVKSARDFVSLQNVKSRSKLPEMTRLLSQGLTHIVRRDLQKASVVTNVITGEANYRVPEGVSKMVLKRRLVQGTKAFAADLQASGDASASRHKSKFGTRKISTRILVVTVE